MRIKFITDTEVLLEQDLSKKPTNKTKETLKQLDDRDIVSYLVEFNEGVKGSQGKDIYELMRNPENLKLITVKLK